VVVTAYGVFCGMTFPLLFEVYKPRERLEPGDKYRTKPEIAALLIKKLSSMGFNFNLILQGKRILTLTQNMLQLNPTKFQCTLL